MSDTAVYVMLATLVMQEKARMTRLRSMVWKVCIRQAFSGVMVLDKFPNICFV